MSGQEMFHWKICANNPFLNCEKIYPIQQRGVEALIASLCQIPEVQQIMIFGSSVTDKCHMGSDIDCYISLSEDLPLPPSPCLEGLEQRSFDRFTNFIVDQRLYNEIIQKGLIVYDRQLA